jgi:hypothetical protein
MEESKEHAEDLAALAAETAEKITSVLQTSPMLLSHANWHLTGNANGNGLIRGLGFGRYTRSRIDVCSRAFRPGRNQAVSQRALSTGREICH